MGRSRLDVLSQQLGTVLPRGRNMYVCVYVKGYGTRENKERCLSLTWRGTKTNQKGKRIKKPRSLQVVDIANHTQVIPKIPISLTPSTPQMLSPLGAGGPGQSASSAESCRTAKKRR